MQEPRVKTSGSEHRTLPPGQHLVGSFLRYGTHLWRPVPDLAELTVLRATGPGASPLNVPIGSLVSMPRRKVTADFHCVAGWSVQNLRWEGVAFRDFYDQVLAPIAGDRITHVRFVGIDGFRSVLPLEDAIEDDVMLADHLDGAPLQPDHGGPVRVVAPSRYAYKSVKHLEAIELHTSEPSDDHRDRLLNVGLRVVKAHPRARVAAEERHRHLPAAVVRWPYFHVLHPVFRALCRIGTPPARKER
jgi:DMSO/TMAO reductase YedYZ molybdopterin-dependent catalytic subunit